MQLKWSLYLGKVSGIKIFVHWTFLILIAWILIVTLQQGEDMAQALIAVMFVLFLFFCVVLHELGHALTAKRFNIETRNITLLPIGGMANIERMPDKPGQELLVAMMGPLVNVVIGIILFVYLWAAQEMPSLEEIKAMQIEGMILGRVFLYNLMVVNFILAAFNMIPAFPMDGGRVLRALLSYKMDRSKATQIAARIGQFLAILFVFLALYQHNFLLAFIGIFVFLGAGGEAAFETSRSVLEGYKVKDVIMHKFTVFQVHDPLQKAIDVMLDSQETEFIIEEEGLVTGVLTRKDIVKGLSDHGKDAAIGLVINREIDFLNPDMELKEVYQMMTTSRQSIYPVMEGGILAGVLDQENLYELIMLRKASKK